MVKLCSASVEVGVPLMVPVVVSMVRPSGSAGVIE